MYLNRLIIIGFLGNDVETKSTASGKTFAQFSVATKTSWKDDKGEWQSNTEWHRVIVWGERLAAYAGTLKKGAHIRVEGPLHSRQYEKDGVDYRVWECKAESILKLDRTDRAEQPAPTEDQPAPEEPPSVTTGKAARRGKRATSEEVPA
ncbi:MAG: single-stranded DNA-binding protein [Acidobacteriia bacterium]|nr:single-stranded DNA-binding protein [Terriglobia bacterium]